MFYYRINFKIYLSEYYFEFLLNWPLFTWESDGGEREREKEREREMQNDKEFCCVYNVLYLNLQCILIPSWGKRMVTFLICMHVLPFMLFSMSISVTQDYSLESFKQTVLTQIKISDIESYYHTYAIT